MPVTKGPAGSQEEHHGSRDYPRRGHGRPLILLRSPSLPGREPEGLGALLAKAGSSQWQAGLGMEAALEPGPALGLEPAWELEPKPALGLEPRP